MGGDYIKLHWKVRLIVGYLGIWLLHRSWLASFFYCFSGNFYSLRPRIMPCVDSLESLELACSLEGSEILVTLSLFHFVSSCSEAWTLKFTHIFTVWIPKIPSLSPVGKAWEQLDLVIVISQLLTTFLSMIFIFLLWEIVLSSSWFSSNTFPVYEHSDSLVDQFLFN